MEQAEYRDKVQELLSSLYEYKLSKIENPTNENKQDLVFYVCRRTEEIINGWSNSKRALIKL